ncbi:MAG: c-type cytochrome [Rhodospirillales bacterium]|nr:c-type cytochrome [Rhodospirillales bacterium]
MTAKISLLSFFLFVFAALPAAADEYAALRETIDICAGCHGENGASKEDAFPILAGQELHYLYVQLKDYKSGLRKNKIMAPVVEKLKKEELYALAKYFSEQKWPRIGFKGDSGRIQNGERAANSGQCVACHLGSYTGNSRIPRVAGQHANYLAKTMLDMKTKARNNAASMSSLIASFSESDISDMAEFMADK